jgi:hypothetical protein
MSEYVVAAVPASDAVPGLCIFCGEKIEKGLLMPCGSCIIHKNAIRAAVENDQHPSDAKDAFAYFQKCRDNLATRVVQGEQWCAEQEHGSAAWKAGYTRYRYLLTLYEHLALLFPEAPCVIDIPMDETKKRSEKRSRKATEPLHHSPGHSDGLDSALSSHPSLFDPPSESAETTTTAGLTS